MKKNYTVVFTAENVSIMRAAVNYDGSTVINQKVTDKIRHCQSVEIEKIISAGVSGMTEKDGITVNKNGLFISNNYGGKMKDIAGLSGFAGNNRKCVERAKDPNSICSKCFSFIGSKFSNLNAWTKNDTILSTVKFAAGDLIVDPEMVPEMRYSTHGDLINSLHAYNLLVNAYSNPETQFTLWTKNHYEYSTGLRSFIADYGKKPENMRVLFSASRLNQMYTEKQLTALKNNGYDGIFTVYSTWQAQKNAIAAGAYGCVCGKYSCKNRCHFCYDYYRNNAVWNSDKAVWIAEILDGEKHRE